MSRLPGVTSIVAGRDLAVIRSQLGREPHAMSAVASRCPHGFPAVAECLPADEKSRPFPTLYYCTCPTLTASIGALESAGGVKDWSRRVAGSASLGAAVAAAAEATRRRRHALALAFDLTFLDDGASLETGVGGVTDLTAVKCLHAHVAHALACPGYLVGEALFAELRRPWCEDRRCAAWSSCRPG